MAALQELAITKIATINNIDAKVVASTELFYVPVGKKLIIPFGPAIRVTSFTSGGKSIQAIASFGGNIITYDDYINSESITIAGANVVRWTTTPSGVLPIYIAGTSFRIIIEVGSNATTETWSVDLFGYLI